MGRATKDKRDLYYRRAKEEGWRARSAYKLIQIDETFGIFDGVRNAVDLCAAPGSWSQVLSRRLYLPALAAREAAREERRRRRRREEKEREGKDDENGENKNGEDSGDADDDEANLPPLPCIVAVDLQPMAPVEGIFQIQGDITSAATAAAVIAAMSRGGGEEGEEDSGKSGSGDSSNDGGGKTPRAAKTSSSPSRAQLVVCDGAPDVTGLHDMDEFMQSQLVVAALTVATELLEEGGTLVAKVFRGREAPALLAQLEPFFRGQPLCSSSPSSARPPPSSYGGGVFLAKPRASRNASVEAFVVCRGYRAPEGLVPRLSGGKEGLWPALAGAAARVGEEEEEEATSSPSSSPSSATGKLIPFVACGDLRGWDADRSYDLPAAPAGARRGRKDGKKKMDGSGCGNGGGDGGDGEEEEESGEESEEEEAFYVPLPPTALPTAPAYAAALALQGRPAAGMKGAGA